MSTIDATFVTSIAMTQRRTVAVQRPHPGDEARTVRAKTQERAKAKIDACGIGSQETRHPRWERCRAL